MNNVECVKVSGRRYLSLSLMSTMPRKYVPACNKDHTMKMVLEIQLHALLTLLLDGGVVSFMPWGKSPRYPLVRSLGGTQSQVGCSSKILSTIHPYSTDNITPTPTTYLRHKMYTGKEVKFAWV